MRFKVSVSLLICFLFTSVVVAQGAFNKFDANGERHGKWKGFYKKTKNLRYIGQFDHGKEVGMFKYFEPTNGKTVIATREFNTSNNTCFVVFYKGKSKVSEGMMLGKKYIGEWRYFHKDSPNLMTLEYYKDGLLDGVRKVYFTDGTLVEQAYYLTGKKHGISKQFNKKGNLIELATFSEGALHGPITYYEPDGTISIEGQYELDKKVGVWSYYKNAKKVREEVKGRSRYPKR